MWHLTLATVDRSRLFPTPVSLYPALHALTRISGRRLLLFCVVDDHVHLVIVGDRPASGRLAGELSRCLSHQSRKPLGPTDLRPVEGRSHLITLVDYLLRQPIRHDLPGHPAAWEGSCFADLIGARHLPGFDPTAVLAELPRLDPSRFWQAVGLRRPDPAAGTPPPSPTELLEAVSAALATDPTRKTPLGTDARALVVRTAIAANLPPRTLTAQLGFARRSISELRARPVDPRLQAACSGQLTLRHAIASAPPPIPTHAERRGIERTRVLAGFRDDPHP